MCLDSLPQNLLNFEEIKEKLLPLLDLSKIEEKNEHKVLEAKGELIDLIQEESQNQQRILARALEELTESITASYQDYVGTKTQELSGVLCAKVDELDKKMDNRFKGAPLLRLRIGS